MTAKKTKAAEVENDIRPLPFLVAHQSMPRPRAFKLLINQCPGQGGFELTIHTCAAKVLSTIHVLYMSRQGGLSFPSVATKSRGSYSEVNIGIEGVLSK